MTIRTVCVIGLGYIGLPTAAILAKSGVDVIGVDINTRAVDMINQGSVHIVEPGLDAVVRDVVVKGRLRANANVEPADAFIIAVPTPFKGENHEPDLSYIQAASEALAGVLKRGDLVVLESTSPVGTTEKLAAWLADMRPDLTFPHQSSDNADVCIAYCPERVLPGKVLEELISNDRIIGGLSDRCCVSAEQLYNLFVKGSCFSTNARTAEMAKLTENSFRDINIAFANELSMICQELEIDVWHLIDMANRHPRVNILQPGPGVGGHCIAVDPWFIVSKSPNEARLIRIAREVNDFKPEWVLERINNAIDSIVGVGRPIVVCYGLAFKADIDDLRESPALEIASRVSERTDIELYIVEPNVDCLPPSLQSAHLVDIDCIPSNVDLHVLLVDHREFKVMERPQGFVVDTRGVWR